MRANRRVRTDCSCASLGADAHLLADGFVDAIENQHVQVQVQVEIGGTSVALNEEDDTSSSDGRARPTRAAKSMRNGQGKLRTHCRTGMRGITWSIRWAAGSTIRREPQEGQNPRFFQEKVTSSSCRQPSHFTLTKPCSMRPQAR